MKKTFPYLFFTISFFSISQQINTDSLINVLEKEEAYSKKNPILIELSEGLINTNPKKSEYYARTLITGAKKHNDYKNEAKGYKLLGNIKKNFGDNKEALSFFKKGLYVVRDQDYKLTKAELLGSIGGVFSDNKETDSAIFYMTKSLKLFKELDNKRGLTIGSFNLAANYFGRSDYSNTIKYLKETEKYNAFFKSQYFSMRCNSLYGNIFAINNRYDEAKKYLKKAIFQAEQMKSIFDIIENKSAMAGINFREGNIERAIEIRDSLSKLVISIPQIKNHPYVLSSHIDYAYLLVGTGNRKKAKSIYNLYIKPNKGALGVNEDSARLLSLISEERLSKNEINSELKNLYKTENLESKIRGLDIFKFLLQKNNDFEGASMIQDSILKYHKKLSSEKIVSSLQYTLEELDVERKQKENLQLKADKSEQALIISQKEKQTYLLIGVAGLIALALIGLFYISKKQKEKLMLDMQLSVAKAKQEQNNILANDLHDTKAKEIQGIELFLLKNGQTTAAEKLKTVRQSIRDISHKLSRITFDKSEFDEQINSLFSEYNSDGFQIIETGLDTINWPKLLDVVKENLFLIIREGLTNAKEHSEASKFYATFLKQKKHLLIILTDNGKGLNKNYKAGKGLTNIALRVKEINGEVTFKNNPKKGLSVNLDILLT